MGFIWRAVRTTALCDVRLMRGGAPMAQTDPMAIPAQGGDGGVPGLMGGNPAGFVQRSVVTIVGGRVMPVAEVAGRAEGEVL